MNANSLANLSVANQKRTKEGSPRIVWLAQLALDHPERLTPAEHRAAKARVDHPELNLSQIAEVLGTSKSSLWSRLRTAIRKVNAGGTWCGSCQSRIPLSHNRCPRCRA